MLTTRVCWYVNEKDRMHYAYKIYKLQDGHWTLNTVRTKRATARHFFVRTVAHNIEHTTHNIHISIWILRSIR